MLQRTVETNQYYQKICLTKISKSLEIPYLGQKYCCKFGGTIL